MSRWLRFIPLFICMTGPGGCGPQTRRVPGDTCTARLRVRLGSIGALQALDNTGAPARADLYWFTVFNDPNATPAFDDSVRPSVADGFIPLIVEGDHLGRAEVPFSRGLDVWVSASASLATPSGLFVASGGSPTFDCVQEQTVEVPVYVGPANGTVGLPSPETAASSPVRAGGTLTVADERRALVFGGEPPADSGSSTPALVYDHRIGSVMTFADHCEGTIEPPPRRGHVAVAVGNGEIAIVGGRFLHDGELATEVTVVRLTPPCDSRSYYLGEGRLGHAAFALSSTHGTNGSVVVVGGEDGVNGPVPDVLEINLVEGTVRVAATLQTPRTEAAVVLGASSQVVVTGGRDAQGALLGDVELIRLSGDAEASPRVRLVAPRARHRALWLDEGPDAGVLLWGGELPSPEAPVIEILQVDTWRALALQPTPAASPRMGHSVTRLPCRSGGVCRYLAVGGHLPGGDPGTPLSPAILTLENDSSEATLERSDWGTGSAYDIATALADQNVLWLRSAGGGGDDTATLQVFSPCRLSPAARIAGAYCPPLR